MRISNRLVFRQFGCCDAVGFKTGVVMAGGLVVIDWSGASVSFITDLVIAGAESRQRAIKRIFVVSRYSTKVSLSLPIFTMIFLSFPEFVLAQAWKMTTETVAITTNTITMNVLDGVFIRPSGLTQCPRAYKHKIRQER